MSRIGTPDRTRTTEEIVNAMRLLQRVEQETGNSTRGLQRKVLRELQPNQLLEVAGILYSGDPLSGIGPMGVKRG